MCRSLRFFICSLLSVTLLVGCGNNGGDSQSNQNNNIENSTLQSNTTQPNQDDLISIDLNDSGFVMDISSDFHFDEFWNCYTSLDDNVKIWTETAKFFDSDHDFQNTILDLEEVKKVDNTKFLIYMHELVDELTGSETQYYIEFGGIHDQYSGVCITVSVEDGDLAKTQSSEIIKSLDSIREKNDVSLGDNQNVVDEVTLNLTFTPEQTAAMSNYMNDGYYALDGDTLYGLVFDCNGNPCLAALNLVVKNSFVEVEDYTIIAKNTAARYVTLYDEDIYYLDYDGKLICASIDGKKQKNVMDKGLISFQIYNNRIYYNDENGYYYVSELDGSQETKLLDKEIYYPYMIQDDWLIYQDDADNESLHIFHLPTRSDMKVTSEPSYHPIIKDHYIFSAIQHGDIKTLARIDINNDFHTEYSGKEVINELAINVAGYFYNGLDIGRLDFGWELIENPGAAYECMYRYVGVDYDIYWDYEGDMVKSIYVTVNETGASISLGSFE